MVVLVLSTVNTVRPECGATQPDAHAVDETTICPADWPPVDPNATNPPAAAATRQIPSTAAPRFRTAPRVRVPRSPAGAGAPRAHPRSRDLPGRPAAAAGGRVTPAPPSHAGWSRS